jgi:hypothetical protein
VRSSVENWLLDLLFEGLWFGGGGEILPRPITYCGILQSENFRSVCCFRHPVQVAPSSNSPKVRAAWDKGLADLHAFFRRDALHS